jgi:DNA invertase Pin-like site-specific DNA recombinase
MKRAYSLIRFSSWKQAKGQSQRRQAEWSASWCGKHHCLLDESLKWDKPVSAFRGANRAKGALAAFLEMIQVGRVPKGSILLVESLDRLSRQELDEALTLFFGILRAGIDIVTMEPERHYTKASVGDIVGLLEPLVIMSRAHEESSIKSVRLLDAWKKRRERAAERPMNAVGPAWLRMVGGRWQPIPEHVATLNHIFNLALEGLGLHAIAARLNRSKTPVMARSEAWAVSSVGKILRNRAVLGEFVPHAIRDGKRVPDGKSVAGYYPAVVDGATFYRVQAALDARRNQRGPRGRHVRNLFTGLLRDARDGCTLVTVTESDKCRSVRLVSSGAQHGHDGSDFRTFSYPAAEGAILQLLKELKASDILPQTNRGVDEVAHWSGRLQDIEHRIGKLTAAMKEGGDFDLGLRLLRDLEAEKKGAVAKLEKVRVERATNEVEVLGETQSLIDLLAEAEGDELLALRTKIKARIAQLVADMRMLIVPQGRQRLAAVQLWFRGGDRHRDYLILYTPGSRHTGGGWRVRSFAEADLPETFDLRDRGHAARLEKMLAAIEL